MHGTRIGSVAVMGLALAVGCDRQDSSAPPAAPAPAPTAPAATPTPAPATAPVTSAPEVPAVGSRSVAEMQSAADRAATDAKAATESARDTARQATTEAQTQAAATAQMTSDEAKKLLDQAVVYVKENKYDLAEKALAQVEAQKASLPKTLQDQLAGARTALNAAKAGGGLKIPGLGGGNANK